jgi:hypothetical protein
MLSLARSGRCSEAIAVYRDGYQVLTTELGIEPSAILQDLHQAILAGDHPTDPTDATAESATVGPTGLRPVAGIWAVPPDLADFTGRAIELTRLLDAVVGRTVVNVCGPGGVGKTALALRLAHATGEGYPDGCLYLDLRGTGDAPADPVQVMGSVLYALGPAGPVPEDPDARAIAYRSALARRSLLLVLDDALDERQVRPLIPPASACAMVITSRRALTGVDGAAVVDLDVFPTADALALLTGLIGSARVADEPVAASRVVELCGRLPLAIRIIGVRLARAPELRLAQAVTRLADLRLRLDELAVDDRTVRASIALSYRRLDPLAAGLFRLLGQLPINEFPSWVAEALLGVRPPAAGDALARLVDVSLVGAERSGAGVRYRIHDLVRAFGQDRARSDDTTSVRAAAVRRLYEALARMSVETATALRSNSFPAVSIPPDLVPPPGRPGSGRPGRVVGGRARLSRRRGPRRGASRVGGRGLADPRRDDRARRQPRRHGRVEGPGRPGPGEPAWGRGARGPTHPHAGARRSPAQPGTRAGVFATSAARPDRVQPRR